MEVAEKLEQLEDEFKILKVELKETLTNVRDFLLIVRPLPGMSGGIYNNDDDDNNMLEIDTDQDLSATDLFGPEDEPPEPEMLTADTESEVPEPEMVSSDDDVPDPEMFNEPSEDEPDDSSESYDVDGEDESNKEILSENELSSEEGGNMGEKPSGAYQNNPQVNLLANLVHWISVAKKDIGSDRLPGFLDVYGVSRQLPAGLKEFILHLAETVEAPAGETNLADAWTRLTLELHGILAGGTPFHSPEAYVEPLYQGNHGSNNGNNGNGNREPGVFTETVEVSQIEY